MWQNAKDHSPKPMTILAALFHSPEEVEKMDLRLKVSKEEKTLALFLVKYRRELRKSEDKPDSLKPFTDFIIDVSFFFIHSLHRNNQMSIVHVSLTKRVGKIYNGTLPRTMCVSDVSHEYSECINHVVGCSDYSLECILLSYSECSH